MTIRRLHGIQIWLNTQGYDALLVTAPANVRYLSGFTGTDCHLLITPRKAFFLADSRYILQAEQELTRAFEIRPVTTRWSENLTRVLAEHGVKSLCFEAAYISVALFTRLRSILKSRARLVPTHSVVENMRQIKTQAEITCLRQAALITRRALSKLHPFIKKGVTEISLKRRLEKILYAHSGEGPSFDIIVASGPQAAMPHAKSSQRRIQSGEPIVVDCGTVVNGYKSDLTRTFFSGNMSQYAHYYRLVAMAQEKALTLIRPGRNISEIDRAAREIFEAAGMAKYFGHALGHGVGLDVHESPTISERNTEKLKSGMVITIEPGLYMPEWGGIRIEDMVLVTRNGYEVLSS